jgi:hypothetical protein
MPRENGPVMRLIGGLRLLGEDWPLSDFAALLADLRVAVAGTDVIHRYVRFFCDVNGCTEVAKYTLAKECLTWLGGVRCKE